MRSRVLFIIGFGLIILLALAAAWPYLNRSSKAAGNVNIFASPIQAGCYIAAPGDCRIHVDPFSIELNTSSKLVFFQLVTNRVGPNTQKIVYDFRTDQSNPAPAIGSSYSPSLVTQDFAATCGQSYNLILEGEDTGDTNPLALGSTNAFTCPATVP